MAINLHRLKDRIQQWFRYPQPSEFQRELLGLYTDSFDIDVTARRLASETSAEYVLKNLRRARNFTTDYDLHEFASEQVSLPGPVLEFGVATGRTIKHWAKLFPDKEIHGFDSFEGLPETWNWNFRAGHFAQKLPRVPKHVTLHKGWFNQTLPTVKHTISDAISLLHVDCDLYSSTVYLLDELTELLAPGTIIVFDEYFNFPGWQQDEHLAWQEFVQKNNIKYEYLAFVSRHQQVCIQIEQINGRQ